MKLNICLNQSSNSKRIKDCRDRRTVTLIAWETLFSEKLHTGLPVVNAKVDCIPYSLKQTHQKPYSLSHVNIGEPRRESAVFIPSKIE